MSCTEPTHDTTFFGGRLVWQASAACVRVSQIAFSAPRRCRPHTHDGAFLAMVTSGGYRESHAGGSIECGPSGIAFHPESMRHADEVLAPGTGMVVVEISSRWIDDLRCEDATAARRPVCATEGTAMGVRRLRAALASAEPGVDARIADLGVELLARIAPARATRSSTRRPSWLRRLIDRLRAECASDLRINDLARDLGLHPVYMARAFQHHTGVTPTEYLRLLRVESAERRLGERRADLADVGLAAGFFDQSHFTRVFKSYTGSTPGAVRRALVARGPTARAPRGATPGFRTPRKP